MPSLLAPEAGDATGPTTAVSPGEPGKVDTVSSVAMLCSWLTVAEVATFSAGSVSLSQLQACELSARVPDPDAQRRCARHKVPVPVPLTQLQAATFETSPRHV